MDLVYNSTDSDQLLTDSSPAVNADYSKEVSDTEKQPCFPHRYRLTLLSFFAFNFAFAMRASFNIALVSMVNFTEPHSYNTSSDECPAPVIQHNHTAQDKPGDFNWTPQEQSLLLGAFFYGYVVTQFPGGVLTERFGPRLVLGLSVLIPGILTILTPFIAHFSPYVLAAVRVIGGCTMGPLFPAFYYLMSRWAPPCERIKLMGIGMNGAGIGTVVAFGLSGYLCNLDFLGGWPLVFYLFGGLGVIWFIIWWILARDSPALDASISPAELKLIESATKHLDEVEYHRPPLRSILTSGPVWVLLIMMAADSLGFYMVFNCAPLFLKQVLKYDIEEDGIMICIPYLCAFVVTLIVTPLPDFIQSRNLLSTTAIRKIFNFIGEGGQAVTLIGIGLAGCNHAAVVSLMTLCVTVSSFSVGGYITNHIDIAPTYAGTIMGLTNGLSNIAGFLTPVIITALTGNSGSRSQWQHSFFLMGGLMALGTLIYTIFGTAKEETWSIEGRERNRISHSQHPTPCPSLESSQVHDNPVST